MALRDGAKRLCRHGSTERTLLLGLASENKFLLRETRLGDDKLPKLAKKLPKVISINYIQILPLRPKAIFV